jgi:hypothetical protein
LTKIGNKGKISFNGMYFPFRFIKQEEKSMKKFGVVLAVLTALCFIGCASGGGGGAAGVDGPRPFIVDLSTLQQVEVIDQSNSTVGGPIPTLRNPEAFTRNWQGMFITIPEDAVDVTQYSRVTVALRYFSADMEELPPGDGMGMIVFVYDMTGDWHGPAMGPGPNTPIKEMNVGGFSGTINRDRGVRHGMNRVPQGVFIQRAQNANVAYIELARIVFHNGNYDSGVDVVGEGPEGS